MSTVELIRAEEIAAAWREGALDDNPAGPVFTGRHYEADITMTGTGSGRCGTVCTASRTIDCC
ncbi:MAG: hypothetical protein JO144_09460 [Actinobacteria bacterium]|nr:hypothetical protein [Actinomycetota bacterium]